MNASRLRRLAGALFCLLATSAAAQEGKVTSQSTVMRLGDFQAMCLLEIDGKPAACFGLHKLPQQKPRYLYLILFKPDPKRERGSGAGGGGSASLGSDGKGKCDLQLTAMPSGREIPIEYKMECDGKAIVSETLKVAGKESGKDGPRVFLVDLADDTTTCHPVKVVPQTVPDLASEEDWGKQILKAKAELIEKSPEAKAFFKAP